MKQKKEEKRLGRCWLATHDLYAGWVGSLILFDPIGPKQHRRVGGGVQNHGPGLGRNGKCVSDFFSLSCLVMLL